MSNSIKSINDLPSVMEVNKTLKGLALVDAIIMPDWESRYFSYNNNWDGHGNEMMASMRDGTGNEYFINFTEDGVVGKVLFNENRPNSSPILNDIPNIFQNFKSEPAFSTHDATFFFWRETKNSTWTSSPSNLNSYPLLGFIRNGINGYLTWAEYYYEKKLDFPILKEVFYSLNINDQQISALNPDVKIEDLESDLKEIL